jgi:hypothetical protein
MTIDRMTLGLGGAGMAAIGGFFALMLLLNQPDDPSTTYLITRAIGVSAAPLLATAGITILVVANALTDTGTRGP